MVHAIKEVIENGYAARLGITSEDSLAAINGQQLEDIFDYYYLCDNEELTATFIKSDGSEVTYSITKDREEDLGIVFAQGLMSDYHSCSNNCIFCFIDQMPPGMRETLYFKDDDTRLSFLQGNYVTLTNIKDKDLDRIISYGLSPINVSVHATDPELRKMMLHNRFAGDIMEKMRKLADAGVRMNGQIVLCKGVNDGDQLKRTITDLMTLCPQMESLSVVPVGLSKYRDGLYPLEPFNAEDAKEIIDIIEDYQNLAMEKFGMHFVQASDELYLLAGQEFPEEDRYDGYIQLENGVGMMRKLKTEFMEALEETKKGLFGPKGKATVVTGRLAEPLINELCAAFMKKFPKVEIEVVAIRNDFFGEMITVSGLLTGQDILAQLKGRNLGDRLLLPCNTLRATEEVFLDDMTLEELSRALQVKTDIVESGGDDFVEVLMSIGHRKRGKYE